MKLLRNKKSVIISFVLGIVIASSITVYATSFLAKDITYKENQTVE